MIDAMKPMNPRNEGRSEMYETKKTDTRHEICILRCKQLYSYAVAVLCVWACIMTFIVIPLISVPMYELYYAHDHCLQLEAEVNSLQGELVHIRHGNAILADEMRKSNETDEKMGKKLIELDDKLDEEFSKLDQQLSNTRSHLDDLQHEMQKSTETDEKMAKKLIDLYDKLADTKFKLDDLSRQATQKQYHQNNMKKYAPASNVAMAQLPTTFTILVCLVILF